ncbi:hypothetical protein [Lacihabitans lacunae]|uniref:Glycosyl transferase n=1 Tax=Lacihabitans lacunae TaxID=1028214 RepID=A0ABV7YS21_9BACT
MKNTLAYFTKKILLFTSPILLVVAAYFIMDPFHVIYKYDKYGSNYLKTYNRNRISTEVFLNHNPEFKFKSFVFGSSRSSAFQTGEWAKFIGDPNPYHFDAFNDNISGISGKMKYIKKQGNKIENAIIVIDGDTFSEQFEESESIVHLKDYRWSGQSFLAYHLTFFKAFFKKQYFISYFDLKIFKTFRPYMDEFFKFKYFYTDPYNDFLFPENIADLKADSLNYYKKPEFLNRFQNPPMESVNIKDHHLADLKVISEILKADNTKYKVIISPLFDQRDFNPVDLEVLQIYFGKENVYNYSGKNKYTNDISNYYEASHFKPVVGTAILSEIYK